MKNTPVGHAGQCGCAAHHAGEGADLFCVLCLRCVTLSDSDKRRTLVLITMTDALLPSCGAEGDFCDVCTRRAAFYSAWSGFWVNRAGVNMLFALICVCGWLSDLTTWKIRGICARLYLRFSSNILHEDSVGFSRRTPWRLVPFSWIHLTGPISSPAVKVHPVENPQYSQLFGKMVRQCVN